MEESRSASCLENLPKCKGMCCKMIGFGIHEEIMPENRSFVISGRDVSRIRYMKMHEGVSVKTKSGNAIITVNESIHSTIIAHKGRYLALFNAPCKHLQSDNTCGIYDSPSRPRVCRDGYSRQKSGVVFCPDCIYKPDDDSLRLKWSDIERMK